MSKKILQALTQAQNPPEQAAIVAEAQLAKLPSAARQVAYRSLILHWFDSSVIAALQQGLEPDSQDPEATFALLSTLPLIESLPWGWAWHEETRLGLLMRDIQTDSEVLVTGARLALPVFQARADDPLSAAEALFCATVAGEIEVAHALLERWLVQDAQSQDWQHMESWFRVLEEAEQLSFVRPFPKSDWYDVFYGQLCEFQGRPEEAITIYSRALQKNPENVLSYLCRGNVYMFLQRREEATNDFLQVVKLGPDAFNPFLQASEIVRDLEAIYVRALQTSEQLFGAEHPITIALLAIQSHLYQALGKPEVARGPVQQLNQELRETQNELARMRVEAARLQQERNEVVAQLQRQNQEAKHTKSYSQPVHPRQSKFTYEGILRAVGQVLDQIGVKSIAIHEEEDGLFVEGFNSDGQLQARIRYDIASLNELITHDEIPEVEPQVSDIEARTLVRFLYDHLRDYVAAR